MGLRGGVVNFCLQKSVPIGRIGIFTIAFLPSLCPSFQHTLYKIQIPASKIIVFEAIYNSPAAHGGQSLPKGWTY